jgi:hypothetical protein
MKRQKRQVKSLSYGQNYHWLIVYASICSLNDEAPTAVSESSANEFNSMPAFEDQIDEPYCTIEHVHP